MCEIKTVPKLKTTYNTEISGSLQLRSIVIRLIECWWWEIITFSINYIEDTGASRDCKTIAQKTANRMHTFQWHTIYRRCIHTNRLLGTFRRAFIYLYLKITVNRFLSLFIAKSVSFTAYYEFSLFIHCIRNTNEPQTQTVMEICKWFNL